MFPVALFLLFIIKLSWKQLKYSGLKSMFLPLVLGCKNRFVLPHSLTFSSRLMPSFGSDQCRSSLCLSSSHPLFSLHSPAFSLYRLSLLFCLLSFLFCSPPSSSSPVPLSLFPNWTVQFENSFAEMSLDFASAAYSADPSPCLAKQNATLQMLQQIPCDALKNECWAFVALSPSKIVFSVRGTRTSAQLVVELIETMTAPKKSFPAGGSVQHYFYASLDALWSVGFGTKLRELKMLNRHLPLLFTGHSLGGAIASLASTRFAFENQDIVKPSEILLVTFGQPRVGNIGYANSHDRLVPNSFRIVHRFDLIAHLPYCYESFLSPHRCISLQNHGPFHHGTEIWYPSDEMNPNRSLFVVCSGHPFGEDDHCSNAHYVHFGVVDHLQYFGRDVDSYGTRGCEGGGMTEGRRRKERKGRKRGSGDNRTRRGGGGRGSAMS